MFPFLTDVHTQGFLDWIITWIVPLFNFLFGYLFIAITKGLVGLFSSLFDGGVFNYILENKLFSSLTDNFNPSSSLFTSFVVISSLIVVICFIVQYIMSIKSPLEAQVRLTAAFKGTFLTVIFVFLIPFLFSIVNDVFADITSLIYGNDEKLSLVDYLWSFGFANGKRAPYPTIPDTDDYFNFAWPFILVALFLYCRLVWKIINRCLGRMFELVFLYFTSPVYSAYYTLDGGAKLSTWIRKVVSRFASIAAISVLYMLIMVISIKVKMPALNSTTKFSESFFRLLLLAASNVFFTKALTHIDEFFELEGSLDFSQQVRQSWGAGKEKFQSWKGRSQKAGQIAGKYSGFNRFRRKGLEKKISGFNKKLGYKGNNLMKYKSKGDVTNKDRNKAIEQLQKLGGKSIAGNFPKRRNLR